MRVLIIEDETVLGQIIKRVLSSHHGVRLVSSLKEAQEILEAQPHDIDVVVSDINLRDGNSPDLHKLMAGKLAEHLVGWVAITGHGLAEERSYFEDLYIQVLDKPFTPSELRQAVEQAYRRKPVP